MFTFIVEFLSIVLAAGSMWHAARYEGRAFAEQWFSAGYLAALIAATIDQGILQTQVYAPTILRIGIAPALVTLLAPSFSYLAFQFSRRFVSENGALSAGLIFLITASFALPLEATATQMGWWLYPSAHRIMFGSVPLGGPVIWGGASAIFYSIFWRIHNSRLPERGRLYAMIALAPVIALVDLAWTLMVGGLLG